MTLTSMARLAVLRMQLARLHAKIEVLVGQYNYPVVLLKN
jgi:hypothetical protein